MDDAKLSKLKKAAELLQRECVATNEAGEAIGTTRQNISYYLGQGRLTPIRIGRTVLVPRDELTELTINPNKQKQVEIEVADG